MANQSWKLWLVPFGLWGLYLCWYSGYQSGYADGHETAWSMSRQSLIATASASPMEFTETSSSDPADVVNR
ncbi:MAG: hypothetical protein H7062_01455 [Candidatus Saccharimonas sp.]|nr:hypothetical protein [Planctomycetaceae bacterium]